MLLSSSSWILCLSFTLWSLFFFFKQKTAYEMRISDWSSDVCSSDLSRPFWGGGGGHLRFTAVAYPPPGLLRHARRVLYGGEDRALPAGYLSRAGDRIDRKSVG